MILLHHIVATIRHAVALWEYWLGIIVFCLSGVFSRPRRSSGGGVAEGVALEQGSEHNANNGAELDQDIESRPRGVLERIAHSVASDGIFVSLGSFSVSGQTVGFDVFFRIVPGATGVRHRNGHLDTA